MNLWARMGVTINVPESEKDKFLQNPKEGILKALKEGQVTLDGETYFPDIEENDVVGLSEFEVDFSSTKIWL